VKQTIEHRITAVESVVRTLHTYRRRVEEKGPLLNAIHRPHALDTNHRQCARRCSVQVDYEDARWQDHARHIASIDVLINDWTNVHNRLVAELGNRHDN
jgi:hypothetical protein